MDMQALLQSTKEWVVNFPSTYAEYVGRTDMKTVFEPA